MDKSISPEEKILNATIQCIEQYGLEGTTIRRIADIADVNSAAISYYFRSKDKLVERAMEVSLIHAFDWNDFPKPGECSLHERIVSIFSRLVEGSYAFPGLTRAHFFSVFTKGEYDNPAIKKINEFLEELIKDIRAEYPGKNENEIRTALTQIASAAFLIPSLMPGVFSSISNVDFTNTAQLKAYIGRIVERLL